MPWTGEGRGLTWQSNPSVLPSVESQGLLTTKAPLWVTSSLLPILAAPVNPPSLLVTNNTRAVKAASPFILAACQQEQEPACALWQLYWLYSSAEERRGWLSGSSARAGASLSCRNPLLCSEKLGTVFGALPCPGPILSWSNLPSTAFWILAIANAP